MHLQYKGNPQTMDFAIFSVNLQTDSPQNPGQKMPSDGCNSSSLGVRSFLDPKVCVQILI